MKKIEPSDIIDFLRRVLDNKLDDNITAQKNDTTIIITCSYLGQSIRIEIFYNLLSYCDKHISIDFEITECQRLDLMFYANKILNKKMEESYNLIDKLYRYKESSDIF